MDFQECKGVSEGLIAVSIIIQYLYNFYISIVMKFVVCYSWYTNNFCIINTFTLYVYSCMFRVHM